MEPNKELEQAIESKFLTPSKFALEIEKIVAEENLKEVELGGVLDYKDNSLQENAYPFHDLSLVV